MHIYHRYLSNDSSLIGSRLGARLTYYSEDGDNKKGVIVIDNYWLADKEVVVAIVQSYDEALHYAKGVANGFFVPLPVDYEYARYSGLKAAIRGGA